MNTGLEGPKKLTCVIRQLRLGEVNKSPLEYSQKRVSLRDKIDQKGGHTLLIPELSAPTSWYEISS